MTTPATQLITPSWIAPIVPAGQLLEKHTLVIQGERIQAILPTAEAQQQYVGAVEYSLPGQLLTPGFINCHGHAAMTLLRGVADDREMMDWLTNWIWPVEGELVTPEFVYAGSRLAAAEMMLSGTTTAADTYFFPEETARAYVELGFRGQIAMTVIKFPNNWAKSEEEHIHKGLVFYDEYKNQPLINAAFAPHSPYGVTNKAFEKIRIYAEQLDVPIHLHLHETASEISDSIAEFGVRPIARLESLGIVSPRLQAVHMTQLREDEIALLASHGAQVVHCPESNMKLSSGICPIESLRQAGINVALGTDGAASNNDLDMLGEMRSASFLTKVHTGDATSVAAADALEMMTLNGARFLGREDELGSLEPGKLADITAIDLSGPTFQPIYNPVSQLIYTANGRDVSHVWINGHLKVRNRELLDTDAGEIVSAANGWQEQVKQVLSKQETP